MTSSELRDYATVVAAVVALLVFVINSFSLLRNRRIENLARFFEAHQRLFEPGGYMASNIGAIEAGRLVRDHADEAMEAKFHLMLLEIEQLAILANNRAVPRHTQVYMLGSYTRQVLGALTEQERNSMFWELAIGYLDGLAADTAQYETLTRKSREAFWR
jgi:hypothetical protein